MESCGFGGLVVIVIGLYLFLSVITVIALREFSFRHTLFYLVIAILGVWGSVLFSDACYYGIMLCLWMAPLLSLLLLRQMTSSGLRIWATATFVSFAFALAQLALALMASVPLWAKHVTAFFLCLVLSLLALIFWGYFFSEHGWMNAMGGMALLQTHLSEVVSYIRFRVSAKGLFFVVFFILFGGMLVYETGSITWKPGHGTIYITSILSFVILNAGLLFRARENILSDVYRETRKFAAQYEDFNKGVKERRERMKDAIHLGRSGKPGVYVLVIGESANRDHMSAYGYSLDTTPWLSSMKEDPGMLFFDNSYSCHCFTVPTLSYALTAKNQYNTVDLNDALSLIEVAAAAGYDTAWVSTHVRYSAWNTPYSVMASASNQQIWITDDFDMAIVDAVDKLDISDRMLLILHLMGSHLSYHERYPKEFDRFHTLGRHPQYDEYDNSVLYTDFVMKRLTAKVSVLPNFQALLYFSDHSVLVDEGNEKGFGEFAYGKTRIPFFVQVSAAFQAGRKEMYQTLRAARQAVITNDLVYNAMLGLMDIRLEEGYEPENDITNNQYDSGVERFVTMYGQYRIADDPALNLQTADGIKKS